MLTAQERWTIRLGSQESAFERVTVAPRSSTWHTMLQVRSMAMRVLATMSEEYTLLEEGGNACAPLRPYQSGPASPEFTLRVNGVWGRCVVCGLR